MYNFQKFPSIPRFSRDIVITEKIDGTNASIYISPYAESLSPVLVRGETAISEDGFCIVCNRQGYWLLKAASRKGYVFPEGTPGKPKGCDNFAFGKWAYENAYELVEGLGAGSHYGEWWGYKIQRQYGLTEKRFSLFNTARWNEENTPNCCHVVPVLYEGKFTTYYIEDILMTLKEKGSQAAPGFMKPEGIIIYHTAAEQYFKKTIEKDEGKTRA